MKALMARANQFIRAEEDEARGWENFGLYQEDRPSKKDKKSSMREESDRHRALSTSAAASEPTSGCGKKFKREATAYKALNTIFKEPIYKLLSKIKMQPFFRWPQPMKGDPSFQDQNKFCAYHKQNGHRTEGCKAFKAYLESLVKDGHLRDYVKEESKDNSRPHHRDDDGHDSDEPEGIINVIHHGPPPKGSSQASTEARRASH